MEASNEALLAFLEKAKSQTQENIRYCQFFINEIAIGTLDETKAPHDLKECLENVLVHAEEDFGALLHLITLLKKSNESDENPKSQVANLGHEFASHASKTASSITSPNHSPKRFDRTGSKRENTASDQREDFDPLKNESDFNFGGALSNEEKEKAKHHEDIPDEDRTEEEDFVGRLLPSARSGTRAVATPRSKSNASKDKDFARSLPVNVPLRMNPSKLPEMPPELDRDDTPPTTDEIHTSIQQIAKSLHADSIDELPRPPKLFNMAD